MWVAERRRNEPGRTLFTRALGYATNQEAELRRVLSDGRLALDKTRSERALRTIVVGRKNWLFYGSDVHAQAAAAIFTLVASCRLHRLDPLDYLTPLLRVLPCWPDDRYIELAPKSRAATRALLDDAELELPPRRHHRPASRERLIRAARRDPGIRCGSCSGYRSPPTPTASCRARSA